MLLPMSSMLKNQLYILNKLFLSRNTHKIRLYTDRNPPCISPRNSGSVFANSLFVVTLWNDNYMNNKNRLYFSSSCWDHPGLT